jgi:hypothetical protein
MLSYTALQAFAAHHLQASEARDMLHCGVAVIVQRLDHPGRAYLLVPVYDARGLQGIVQIDSKSGRVETSLRIAQPGFQFLLPTDAAVLAARESHPKLSGWGVPYLGWQPCVESFDSMAPLWLVPYADGIIYVDRKGRTYDTLTVGQGATGG